MLSGLRNIEMIEHIDTHLFDVFIDVPEISFSDKSQYNRRFSLKDNREIPMRDLVKKRYEILFAQDIYAIDINTKSNKLSLNLYANLHNVTFTSFKLLHDISARNHKITITQKNYAKDGTCIYERNFYGARLLDFDNIFDRLNYNENDVFDFNVTFRYDYYNSIIKDN